MAKKVLIAMPPLMLEQVDFIASSEFRSRSDLIREALRDRIDLFKKKEMYLNGKTVIRPAAGSEILEASTEN